MNENDDLFDGLEQLDLSRSTRESDEPEEPAASRVLAEAVRERALDHLADARKLVSAKAAFESESIHRTRVACKRQRALWQLMRPLIEPQIAQDADARLRGLSAVLAHSRDTQVLQDLLADLRDSDEPLYRSAFDRAAALLDPIESVELDPESTRAALLGGLDADRDQWRLLVLPDDDSIIDHGLVRTYRKAWRRADTAARTRDGEDNHRWRKWTKYLRYQLEALGRPGIDLGSRITSLTRLGSSLGKRNDLHNLYILLKQRNDGDPFGAVFRAIDLRDRALARRVEGIAGALFAPTPDEIAAILRAEISANG